MFALLTLLFACACYFCFSSCACAVLSSELHAETTNQGLTDRALCVMALLVVLEVIIKIKHGQYLTFKMSHFCSASMLKFRHTVC